MKLQSGLQVGQKPDLLTNMRANQTNRPYIFQNGQNLYIEIDILYCAYKNIKINFFEEKVPRTVGECIFDS